MASKHSKRGENGASGKPEKTEQFRKISHSTSEIVKQAAQLLDDEMAAGIVAAKAMRKRFDKERKVDPADFKDALSKLREDAHSLIGLMSDQLAAFRKDENSEIVERFVGRSHDLLDLAVESVETATALTNQLLVKTRPTTAAKVQPNAK